ncbi:MAG TPA: TonB-dependent receptor [Niabella sp.]|nr:TonB-dependent receptor [Niabella sp.]
MRKIYLGLLIAMLFHLSANAQQTVNGKVLTSRNEPLPNASVVIKGTSVGVNTDSLGEFSLTAAITDSLLVSYTGYEPKTVLVGQSKVLTIMLSELSGTLSDVVIVAFGTQRKEAVVGSVTSINPEELKIPSSNLTTALAGRMAGVIAYQRSGEPGADNADFFIRGVTTFGYKKDPLILIDGIELTSTDLARLNPNDIASFSIMKDATSTALYGARGANGVILVTTKQGKVGKAKIALTVENSISRPTKNVELADPVTYMKLHNEAILTRDPTLPLLYSEDKIDNTAAGTNPYIYPATDWRKELFKEQAANQRANLNVSGGGPVARYYVSGTFAQDNGVLKVDKKNNFNSNINLKTYSLRSNVNINIFPTTELIVRLAGVFDDYTGPIYSGNDMYKRVMRANPVLFPAYYPMDDKHSFVKHIMFGNFDLAKLINPYADMVKGYKNYTRSNMNAQLELSQSLSMITKGLKARGRFNTARISFFDVSRQYNPFFYQLAGYNVRANTYNINIINPLEGTEYLNYNEGSKDIQSTVYMEGALDYSRNFDKHSLNAMLVYTRQEILKANAGSLQASLPSRNMGLAGRATYGFDSRYYLEFNFGYNGSERFYKTHRWGFFPSAGFAWNVSNEKFMEGNIASVINNLKVRGTYGFVGNDAIGSGRFLYLSEVNLDNSGTSAVFGRDNTYSRNGISIARYADQNITWETAQKSNIAVELGLFNKLNIIAEYFNEHRKNILQTRASVPGSMGLWVTPATNIGEAKGQGVDVSMDYNHNFGNNLSLKGIANFTYATSKFTVYDEPDYGAAYWRSRLGYPISQTWGYIAESLFADDAEVQSSPSQSFGGTQVLGGDIKYRDVNGDGIISTLDMVPIGFPTEPEIVYGFGISGEYKNFDFATFFQGLARESFWIDPAATAPFIPYHYNNDERNSGLIYTNQLLKAYADNYWSEENPNLYALWPRLSATTQPNNTQPSTWFMRNGSFLRLKQVELGYTLPGRISSKAGLSNFRIYVSALNLFTWSKFKLWDVEMAGNGLQYPIQKVYNIGINVGFN